MSDRRKLHELISETFEPKPNSHDLRFRSPVWKLSIGHVWQPVDFDTDEAANAMLLEAMPFPRLVKDENGVWGCRPDYRYCDGLWPFHSDRKTAIVNAYCKWKGIEVSGENT